MQLTELAVVTTYAGPPVIGAFIGYVTNRIAIKMLFRPLNPWKIAGIRVPMTPGVIPSKRYALAENIGSMVGEHLLTGKEVGEALSREPFQEHLDQMVDKQLSLFLEKKYDAISAMVPTDYEPALENMLSLLSSRLGTRFHSYVCSEEGGAQISSYIQGLLDNLGEQPINSVVSPDARTGLYNAMANGIVTLLSDEKTGRRLAAYLQSMLENAAKEGKNAGDLIPETVVSALQAKVKEQTPALMRELGLRMGEPAIRKRIITGVVSGVDRFIDSLGPVGAMARGFIDMESLESVIDGYLNEKEDDILSWLQEPEVTGPVEEVLVGKIEEMLKTPLAEVMEKAGEEQVESFCRACVDKCTQFLVGGPSDSIALMLHTGIEPLLENGDSPMRVILGGRKDSADDVQEKPAGELLRFLRSDSGREGIQSFILEAGRMLTNNPIGTISAFFSRDIVNGVKAYVIRKSNRILLNEVPGLVKSLQINRLITEKVNSLDLLKLEGLLLSIMEEQFKYINLFGGLLGFIIGCINLLLLKVM